MGKWRRRFSEVEFLQKNTACKELTKRTTRQKEHTRSEEKARSQTQGNIFVRGNTRKRALLVPYFHNIVGAIRPLRNSTLIASTSTAFLFLAVLLEKDCMLLVKVALSPLARSAFTSMAYYATMRLSTALAPLLYLFFCGAPASHIYTSAAPAAAPAAAAAPPAAPAAPANAAGVVPLPEDEALDPTEVVHKATTTDTKNSYRDICTDFCVYLYASGDEFVLAPSTRTAFNAIDAQYDDTPKGKKQRTDAMRAKVKEWLIVDEKKKAGSRQQHKLLDFRRYKPEVVVKYMCSRKQIKKNPSTGQKEERLLGNSRYSAIRTALMTYLAEVYDHEWTSKQLAFMKKALKGISKETSKSAQNKGRQDDMEPGKKAMSFELYEKTNQWLIEQGDRSAVDEFDAECSFGFGGRKWQCRRQCTSWSCSRGRC